MAKANSKFYIFSKEKRKKTGKHRKLQSSNSNIKRHYNVPKTKEW